MIDWFKKYLTRTRVEAALIGGAMIAVGTAVPGLQFLVVPGVAQLGSALPSQLTGGVSGLIVRGVTKGVSLIKK